ncbi:hypothetical protein CKO31_18410 [Thiohalocapsa halophila]|uniref:Uncharacterized protein n=1 Tax=Thiohalocapsa halophila TaxID=69359 RepID=A0ABS1CLB1_9GAMM|nr:hypothetical protein [Thiohalocapsa halophila]MBK1632680.1 hypothetical protein [Thiohalocapsa halophila]
MRKRLLTLASGVVSIAALALAGPAAGEDDAGSIDPAEKYQGFAEDNPDLVDDRGNGLPVEGEPRSEAAMGTADTQTYPEPVAEDNPQLPTDRPDTERPYAGETDVHGAFGEGNPDVQR